MAEDKDKKDLEEQAAAEQAAAEKALAEQAAAAGGAETETATETAAAAEIPVLDFDEKLKSLGLKPAEIAKLKKEGASSDEDMEGLTAAEIKEASGCGIVTAKKVCAAFQAAEEIATEAEAEKVSEKAATAMQASFEMLPEVPDNTTFTGMLKIGGELKVGKTEVISAIRASLADKVGLYGLLDLLLGRMKVWAKEQGIPCTKDFYDLQKFKTRRNYSDIFAALEITSASVTQSSKKELLESFNAAIWPALLSFQKKITSWEENWASTLNTSTMMNMGMVFMGGAGKSGPMPAGMTNIPDSSVLVVAAEAIMDVINRTFAADGIVIARALASDANQVKDALSNPNLPGQIGATTYEQMIKQLNAQVPADYPTLETNTTKYALSLMEFSEVSLEKRPYYVNEMFQLGNNIPWDTLQGGRPGAGSASFLADDNG